MAKPTFKKIFKVQDEITPAEIDEIVEVAKETGAVYDIEISKIDAPHFHDRTSYDDSDIRSLAENIRNIGLLQPIAVVQSESGRFIRVAGFRRLEAMKLIGKTTIKAVVLSVENEAEMCFAMLSENIQRVNLDAYDEVRAITEVISKTIGLSFNETKSFMNRITNFGSGNVKSLSESEELMKEKIEQKLKELGKYTFASFRARMVVLNMHTSIISAMKNRTIDYTYAKEIHRLKNLDNKMLETLELAIKGSFETSRQLKLHIDAILAKINKASPIIKNKVVHATKDRGIYSLKIKESGLNEEQKTILEKFLISLKTNY